MSDAQGGSPLRSLASAWHLALRNLLQDRVRFVLSVVAVALALMLILFLLGLRAGAQRGAVVYLENVSGSVVVLPPGVSTTGAGSTQFLGPELVAEVASTDGVGKVTPILLTMGFSELHGTKEGVKLVGYDASLGGGPWDLHKGREPEADDEVVLDRVVADRHGLGIGDSFALGGQTLTIVGLSNETASFTGSYAFARRSAVERIVLAPSAASLLVVTPAPGTTADALVARLGGIQVTNVLLKRELMDNDAELIAGVLDQILFLMIGAAFVVGVLVVGMVIYTATNERRSEYGILKAIGAGNGMLYRVVASQSLAAGSLGAALGVGFAFVMGWLVATARPQFPVIIEPSALAVAIAAGLSMALAGGLLPARSAGRLAPAEVFRR